MSERSSIALDSLDQALIAEMEHNAHQTVSDLSRKLDLQRHNIDRRLQKLLDDRIIRIVAAHNPLALGFTTLAFMGINTFPSAVNSVAQELGCHREIHYLTITTGRYDIHAWGMFRRQEELSGFVRDELSRVQGITAAETMVNLRVVTMSFGLLSANPVIHKSPPEPRHLDVLDRELIREISRNPRQTYNALARVLGSSSKTVWRRLQKLLEERILKIIAIPNPEALGFTSRATIAIDAKPDSVDAVAESLASFVNIHGVVINAGRFDILAFGDFRGSKHLSDFVTNELSQISGLLRHETMISLKTVKDSVFFEAEDD